MSANLDTALTRYQRRTGLQPDGYVAPDGPTVQQIAAEAEAGVNKALTQNTPEITNQNADAAGPDPAQTEPENWEKPASESAACRKAKVDFVNFSDNLEGARSQLKEEQQRLASVEQALQEISEGGSKGLLEKTLDSFITHVLKRFGLAGLIVYAIYKGEKIIDRGATMGNLRNRRKGLQDEVEIQKKRVQTILEKVEDARERKLTHCGRNALPEEPDKISRHRASGASEA
jgi:hypothetical protein